MPNAVKASCLIVLTSLVCSAQVPVIAPNGTVNGASGLAGIASGSWISIFGTNLSQTTRIWSGTDFQGDRLPLSLDGVSVKVNNRDAAVYFISPTQINALALTDTALGSIAVTVTTSRGTSAGVLANYQQYAPAFFTFDPQNHIYPAAVRPNGTLVGRTNLLGTAVATVPAAPGERILLFGTGFGPTTPQVDPSVTFAGAAPLSLPSDLSILVGGVPATVEFAGLAGNGLYQFNIVVPNVTDGDQTLVAQIGGQRSQSTLRLTVFSPPKPQIRYPGATQQAAMGCPGSGCIGTVTASPGEQIDFWVAGTDLTAVTSFQFLPPDGIDVSQIQITSTTVHAVLKLSAGAALGRRQFFVTSQAGDSNQSPGALNISTFRISNLRITDISNIDNTLNFTATVDYTDPTGAVSSGQLSTTSEVLIFSGTILVGGGYKFDPPGRTPGATSGVITLVNSFPNLKGTTGAIFQIGFTANDGRQSDILRTAF